jgi:hypothetical protein
MQIGKDGSVTLAFHPDKQATDAAALTEGLGTVTEEARGGHVYPVNRARRWAFKSLRRIFGGKGLVADWTRAWRGPWYVERADTGERLPGTYKTHGAAVTAEVSWILKTKGGRHA